VLSSIVSCSFFSSSENDNKPKKAANNKQDISVSNFDSISIDFLIIVQRKLSAFYCEIKINEVEDFVNEFRLLHQLT